MAAWIDCGVRCRNVRLSSRPIEKSPSVQDAGFHRPRAGNPAFPAKTAERNWIEKQHLSVCQVEVIS